MKNEIENSIRGFSFLCRLTDIKNAWINPWKYNGAFLLQYNTSQLLYRFNAKKEWNRCYTKTWNGDIWNYDNITNVKVAKTILGIFFTAEMFLFSFSLFLGWYLECRLYSCGDGHRKATVFWGLFDFVVRTY